ncbi:MAG: WD40/YVTN/BNR-like repeat-containing protein, partial [Blastocatellia bacterium]
MNRLLQTLLTAVLLCIATAVAQAQWVVAFQDKSKRDLNGVFFMDGRFGWVIGDRGIIHVTQDNGSDWGAQDSRLNDNLNDIFFRTRDDGWLVTSGATGSRILKTVDGGDNWELVFQLGVAPGARRTDVPVLYSVAFPNKKQGWVVGADGRILHSEDGGINWRRQESGTQDELVHVKFVNDKRGWVVGAKGTILYTDDGGRTWERQNAGTTNHLYHIETRGKENAWVVGDKGTVLRTTNAGLSWERVAVDTTQNLLNIAFANDKQGWIIGWNGTILRSGDGGKNWIEQESGTRTHLYGISASKKEVWVVGAEGLILKYTD